MWVGWLVGGWVDVRECCVAIIILKACTCLCNNYFLKACTCTAKKLQQKTTT